MIGRGRLDLKATFLTAAGAKVTEHDARGYQEMGGTGQFGDSMKVLATGRACMQREVGPSWRLLSSYVQAVPRRWLTLEAVSAKEAAAEEPHGQTHLTLVVSNHSCCLDSVDGLCYLITAS